MNHARSSSAHSTGRFPRTPCRCAGRSSEEVAGYPDIRPAKSGLRRIRDVNRASLIARKLLARHHRSDLAPTWPGGSRRHGESAQ